MVSIYEDKDLYLNAGQYCEYLFSKLLVIWKVFISDLNIRKCKKHMVERKTFDNYDFLISIFDKNMQEVLGIVFQRNMVKNFKY